MENSNTDLFDQFLEGSLNDKALTEFQDRLKKDDSFKEEFELYNLISSGIAYAGATDLKQTLIEREKVIAAKEASTKPKYSMTFKVAAAILLLAITTFLVRDVYNRPDYSALYGENYQPYPNVVQPINRSSEEVKLDYSQLYEMQEFGKAVAAIKKMNNNSDTSKFYLGQSYMALDSIELALAEFESVDMNSVFGEAAEWYKALCFLKQKELDSCKEQLSKIAKSDSAYKARAEKLLSEL